MNKKIELENTLNEATKSEKNGAYFSAAILYKEALVLADKAQDSKLIKLCKTKVVEMNKRSQEAGDFEEYQFDYKLTRKETSILKKFLIGILKIKNKTKTLRLIGLHPYFMPNFDAVETTSKESVPIAYQFATLNVISSEGHNLRGGSLGQYSWFIQMYDITQKQIMVLYLNKLMYMLIHKNTYGGEMTLKEISNYFSDSNLFKQDKLEIVLHGLESYYNEDYVSALHVLIPQFEALLINIARGFGINMIALDKSVDVATRTSVLSERDLDSEGFQKIFGKNFCTQIKFVLFEPMGYKLRHKIAHGEITFTECNFQNTTLVVYLYLVILARVRVKATTNKTKPKTSDSKKVELEP